jgi:hypothetical protein
VIEEKPSADVKAIAKSINQQSSTIPDSWTEKGSVETVQGCILYWCQDRYSVTLHISVPAEGKWTCNVSNMLAFVDRFAAVGNANKSVLEIRRADETDNVLLQAELAYPVHAAEDEEHDVDWSIESHGTDKYMFVTLHKATQMAGVTLWWKRPLSEMKEISLEWRDQASTSFQNVWNEAHDQFLDRQQNESNL